MEKYERIIGLKTFWTTIVRRAHIFFMIFIPIAGISFVVTNHMIKKTYISTITITRGAVINATHYALIQNYIINASSDPEQPGAVYTTAMNLSEEGFKHANGSEITTAEISSGLSFTALASNSVTMSFSFQSFDNTITQKVLNELAKNAIANLKKNAGVDYKNMEVSGSGASASIKNSKELTYFFVALASGFVVAFGIPFVDEIVGDEVYNKNDIESLGSSAFEINTNPKKKEA